ncbi:MAG: right-handed parallel beta-helix repeat-containing protein [Desulfobacteraceae bacterium]|nr:right-handed parallel beta-helix repeat-containing protein [Desulfobacteraceae bacterium]
MAKRIIGSNDQVNYFTSTFNIKMMIAVVITLLYCFFNNTICMAATYYIDSTTGSDNQAGTLIKPWKTLSKIYLTSMTPGDTISLKKGSVWDENLNILFSGTSESPISIRTYGSATASPKIRGFIYISATDIQIQNIEIVQSELSGVIIDGQSAERITINDCILKNHALSGILITEGDSRDLSFSGNVIENSPMGIIAFNTSTEHFPTQILNNSISSMESIDIFIQGDSHEIRENDFFGNSQVGIMIDGGSERTIIADNDIRNSTTACVFISSTAESGHQITGNSFTDSNLGLFLSNNNPAESPTIVSGNLMQNNQTAGIYVSGQGFQIDDNLLIDNGEAGVFLISPSQDITILNNDISGHGNAGIYITEGLSSHINVIGNSIFNNSGNGIAALEHSVYGAETFIADNDVNGNGFNGILIQGDYHIVELNRVENNGSATRNLSWGATGIQVYARSSTDQAKHNLIRYNIVSDTKGNSEGSDGNGILIDEWCTNNMIHHNITFENQGPGFGVYGGSDNRFFNNIAYNNSIDGERQYLSRMEVVVASKAYPVSANNIFQNNIIFSVDQGVVPVIVDWNAHDKNNQFGHNIIQNSQGGDLFYWNDNVGSEIDNWNHLSEGNGDDFSIDPEFVNAENKNFQIISTSQAINRGIDVGLTDDFFGNPIPDSGTPDIGIFEYQATP